MYTYYEYIVHKGLHEEMHNAAHEKCMRQST